MLLSTAAVHPSLVNRSFAIEGRLSLAPGFRAIAAGRDPLAEALAAVTQDAEPGDVFWIEAEGCCNAAFVLAPDRPLGVEPLTRDLGMLALFDAVAVLAPPQVPVHVMLPDGLGVDGARVATLQVAVGPAEPGAVASWAVLGLHADLGVLTSEPGDAPDRTSLYEEGFGDVAASELLALISRHMLLWLDTLQQDGADALARIVARRTAIHQVAA